MHAGGRTHVASRLPPGRMRVTRAAVAAALAVVAATAAVAFWGNRDLPVFLKARPAARVVGAPVPPVEERLFGPPLRRIRLDDQTPEFEPEAYAMCVPFLLYPISCASLTSWTTGTDSRRQLLVDALVVGPVQTRSCLPPNAVHC